MQDEIWHQFGIQNYNGNVLSVYSVCGVFYQNSVIFLLIGPVDRTEIIIMDKVIHITTAQF